MFRDVTRNLWAPMQEILKVPHISNIERHRRYIERGGESDNWGARIELRVACRYMWGPEEWMWE